MIYLRSLLFNFCFYGVTALMCFIFLPALLFHKGGILWVARFYLRVNYFFERHILKLDYEVRGLEKLNGLSDEGDEGLEVYIDWDPSVSD